MNRIKRTSFILLTIILLASCSSVEKELKSNDFDAKYASAMRYYEDHSYSKAIQLFENLTLYYRGKDHAENICWYYGQALMKEKDYFNAGYQFRNFVRQYPYSERSEEALFLAAYCRYMDSPAYTLDQSRTKEAISDFEQFVERYPQSKHIPEVNQYLDEMRTKLMRKDYEIAYGYYVIEQYHAAYISLQNFLNYYPESQYREDATFYMLRSGFEYAINSREDKMRERLQQVINDFDRFSTTFSNSKYLQQAQDIYTRCRAELAKMESQPSKTSN